MGARFGDDFLDMDGRREHTANTNEGMKYTHTAHVEKTKQDLETTHG
jgi:hypothetical protein